MPGQAGAAGGRASDHAVLHDSRAEHRARGALRILRSQTRSSIACINRSCGIASKHEAMSVSTTHRRPCQASSISTCRAPARRPLPPKAERAGRKVGLKERLDDELAAAHAMRSRAAGIESGRCSEPAGLQYPYPARRKRRTLLSPHVRRQLFEQPLGSAGFHSGDGDAVDAGCAPACAHLQPRTLQNVPAVDLVTRAHGTVVRGRPPPPCSPLRGLDPSLVRRD